MRLPPARATIILGGTIAAAWGFVALAGMNEQAALAGGFIAERWQPGGQIMVDAALGLERIVFVPAWLTPLSATLVHGGLLHVAFNLLMLGFCGRFVEVALGWRGVAILFVIGAYAGALGQFLVDPHGVSPMIGASGAISALLGAYALLFGERRGGLATHRFGKTIQIVWLAGAWIGFQLLMGYATRQDGVGIAIAAHIGGFLAGLALAQPMLRWRYRNA